MRSVIVLLLIYGAIPSLAQPPDVLWTQTFGGADQDYGYDVQQTTDGGYIITGSTRSFGEGVEDALLIKADSNGNEIWSQTFGGTNSDYGTSVQQTTDGGYAIIGRTYSFGGDDDLWLIKTDYAGNEEWSQIFGGSMANNICQDGQQTLDGGYILVGSGTNIILIKTDSAGNEMWTQTFGGVGTDWAYSVQQTTDGGYIITGYTNSVIEI